MIYSAANPYLCRFHEKPNPSPEHPWTERKFGCNILPGRFWRILPGGKACFLYLTELFISFTLQVFWSFPVHNDTILLAWNILQYFKTTKNKISKAHTLHLDQKPSFSLLIPTKTGSLSRKGYNNTVGDSGSSTWPASANSKPETEHIHSAQDTRLQRCPRWCLTWQLLRAISVVEARTESDTSPFAHTVPLCLAQSGWNWDLLEY